MKNRIGYLMRILLTCVLCMLGVLVSASAAQVRREPLDCTEFSGSMINEAEGWYWDQKTRTLTLINAYIDPDTVWKVENDLLVEDTTINGVILPAGSIVVLLGENTIEARANGIYSEGAVTFAQRTILAPDDLNQLNGKAEGVLNVTGGKQAVAVGAWTNEGTLTAGSNWYTAIEASEPGSNRYACVTVIPRIVIDLTACGAVIENDGFYLNEKGAISEKYQVTGAYTLTGASNAASHAIKVRAGADVLLTLENVQLDLSEQRWKTPLSIESGAKVELIYRGLNTLQAGTTCAAIEVAEGATLTISKECTGGLTAVGGAGAAGIGGGSGDACGTVNVEGGVIQATGRSGGAGIGQGSGGTNGSFNVLGGKLLLCGGSGAAGFGGGADSIGGSAAVTGGVVTARGGQNAPGVGAGENAEGFKTTISGGTVAATGGKSASGVGAGAGASGCVTAISDGIVQSGGGRGAAGLSAGGSAERLTTEEGVIPVLPESGSTQTAPNTMTVSGGSISAAAGIGAETVADNVSGGDQVNAVNAVIEPAFAMPEDDTTGTYESYLAKLPTEDDVREEQGTPTDPDEPEDNSGAAEKKFDDLDGDAWYISALDYVAAHELIDAIDGHRTFAPNKEATRAVVVEALWRMVGHPAAEKDEAFDDVAADAPNAEAIAWAQQTGIVTGDENGMFRPADNITRQEMCAILARFAAWRGISLQASLQGEFEDADDIAGWAREAVYLCRSSGLVEGREDGRFYPNDSVTRAELAQMLYNLGQMQTEEKEESNGGAVRTG